jgi:hypothetical protein
VDYSLGPAQASRVYGKFAKTTAHPPAFVKSVAVVVVGLTSDPSIPHYVVLFRTGSTRCEIISKSTTVINGGRVGWTATTAAAAPPVRNDWQLIAAVLRGNRCVTRVQLLEPDMVPLVDGGDSRWVSLDYLQSALEQNAQSAKPAPVSPQPPLSGI